MNYLSGFRVFTLLFGQLGRTEERQDVRLLNMAFSSDPERLRWTPSGLDVLGVGADPGVYEVAGMASLLDRHH